MSSVPSSQPARAAFIDATRGMAMFFVCLSHFGLFCFSNGQSESGWKWTYFLGMVATPTFVLLSGILLGYLHSGWNGLPQTFRDKLIDRGLFLLTAGHVLILTAHLPIEMKAPDGNLRWFFITDVIAICLVLGPLAMRLRMKTRAMLAALLLMGTWAWYVIAHPESEWGRLAESMLLGGHDRPHRPKMFPLLPWMGVYLAGSLIGNRLEVWQKQGRRLVRRMGLLSLGSIALAAVLFVTRYLLTARISGEQGALARMLLSPAQKYPPGPSYLALFGGVGLFLLTLAFAVQKKGWLPRAFALLARIGQTSLFIFVAQYYVYYVGFFLLKPGYTAWWPLIFAASLLVLALLALVWHSRRLNRYWTVGFPWRLSSQRDVASGRGSV